MNEKTVIYLYRIAGSLFAFACGMNAIAAYKDMHHERPATPHILTAVAFLGVSLAFLAVSRMKSRNSV